MMAGPCAWIRAAGFSVGIPTSLIALVGNGPPPPGPTVRRLESVLTGDGADHDASHFLHLQWADGAALILTFEGSIRFAGVQAAAVRPLGLFLGALREAIGVVGVVAISDSELGFVLDPRALLPPAIGAPS